MRITTLVAHKDYFEFLPKAISSVLRQTKKSFLCIVDASNDDTRLEKIIHVYLSKRVNVQYNNDMTIWSGDNFVVISVHNMETNPSILRNIGIEATINNTDMYMILDADDEMLPTKTERMASVIEMAPDEIGVVYADHLTVNTVTGEESIEYREPFSLIRLRQECIVHSNAAITSLALKAVKDQFGYYDCTMRTCEDYDLWMRISKRFMIVHLAEILSLVRVQPRNSTATVDKEIWNRNWRRVHEKILQAHS